MHTKNKLEKNMFDVEKALSFLKTTIQRGQYKFYSARLKSKSPSLKVNKCNS